VEFLSVALAAVLATLLIDEEGKGPTALVDGKTALDVPQWIALCLLVSGAAVMVGMRSKAAEV
jgi:hypothetical protein